MTETAARSVARSDELFAPVGNHVELCYQTFGDPDHEPILLIMGLGGPMTWWDAEFCEQLAAKGFLVIRYDNRDTGRSTTMRKHRVRKSAIVRAFLGASVNAPYTLDDMGADAFALMDHLGLESAHLVGVSMGGMIAQTMAIADQARVRTLTSIMSSTGKKTVGWQHPALLPNLLAPRGKGRDTYIEASTIIWGRLGSPAFPTPDEVTKARAGETYDRGQSPSGVMRQMLAVLSQPNRAPRLRGLTMPALVIHGLADRMVHHSGGRATAAAIPKAELILIEGMGHDMPSQLWEQFIDAIARTTRRAV